MWEVNTTMLGTDHTTLYVPKRVANIWSLVPIFACAMEHRTYFFSHIDLFISLKHVFYMLTLAANVTSD
jgi:hypothetical protein